MLVLWHKTQGVFHTIEHKELCGMDKYLVEGGTKLYGKIRAQCAKNAVLPLLAAAVLTDEQVKIYNMPMISDVENMLHILSDPSFFGAASFQFVPAGCAAGSGDSGAAVRYHCARYGVSLRDLQ